MKSITFTLLLVLAVTISMVMSAPAAPKRHRRYNAAVRRIIRRDSMKLQQVQHQLVTKQQTPDYDEEYYQDPEEYQVIRPTHDDGLVYNHDIRPFGRR